MSGMKKFTKLMSSELDMTSKPVVWVHATENQRATNGWRTDFLDMVTKHFQLVTAQDVDKDPALGQQVRGALLIDLPTLTRQLGAMPNLRAVASHGAGYNHIDVKAFAEEGILVSNTPDVLNSGVADMGMALILASARNVVSGVRKAMGPEAPEFVLNELGVDVCGKTLGIVGMGGIGMRLAKRACAFEMPILYHNRKRRSVLEETKVGATYSETLNAMLPLCDYVIVICPLTPATKGMFGEKQFRLMKNSATIVNIARGPIIDQDALYVALRDGHIRAAALDVTSPEPLPRDHPLLTLPNIIITPHLGSATVETRRAMCQCAVDNLRAVLLDGKDHMPNQVN